jgi:hypothetical protein
MEIYSLIAILSFTVLGLSYLLILIAGFQVNLWWGFVNLVLGPLPFIPFIFMHWNKAKYSVLTAVSGVFLFGLAAIVHVETQKPESIGGKKLGYSLIKPEAWKINEGLFDNADLQLSRSTKDLHFATFSEKRKQTSLSRFTLASAKEIGSQLEQVTISECTEVVISNM